VPHDDDLEGYVSPRVTAGSRESVPALLIFRHVPGYLSQDWPVRYDDPRLRHHSNEVPIADRSILLERGDDAA
jgi:hypothetical protein